MTARRQGRRVTARHALAARRRAPRSPRSCSDVETSATREDAGCAGARRQKFGYMARHAASRAACAVHSPVRRVPARRRVHLDTARAREEGRGPAGSACRRGGARPGRCAAGAGAAPRAEPGHQVRRALRRRVGRDQQDRGRHRRLRLCDRHRRRRGQGRRGRGPLHRLPDGRHRVRQLRASQAALHLRARRGPGDQGLGRGRRRHESRRQAQAHHPVEARLRRAPRRKDPAQLDAHLHDRAARRHPAAPAPAAAHRLRGQAAGDQAPREEPRRRGLQARRRPRGEGQRHRVRALPRHAQGRHRVRLVALAAQAAGVRARHRTRDQGLGHRHRRHEGRRPAQADDPRRARLR